MRHSAIRKTAIALLILVLFSCLLFAGCLDSGLQETSPSPSPTPSPRISATPTPSPSPSREANLKIGASGEEVVKLQKRLIELDFLADGEPNGYYGSVTHEAVSAFQEQHNLTSDGIAGPSTLKLIYSEDAQPYQPFSLLAPTTKMSFAELVGDNGDYDYPKGYPSPDTYQIIVDIAHQVTMVYTQDQNGEYTVPVRYMLCSTGLGNRTPIGTFQMGAYRVRFSKFVRDGRYGQYWTQIRKAIYFHTTLYSAKNAATYLPDTFEELGSKASHGCVRLTIPDARWMWYHIAPGTTCIIRKGTLEDRDTAAIRDQLVLASPPEQQLDLKPGEIPSTDNWTIDEIPHEVPFVQGSQN